MRKTAETEEHRRHAYKTTKSDQEAAALLRMNPHTFKSWRTSRGLPIKNPKPGLRPTEEELDVVRHMLAEDATFGAIAAHINEHSIGNRKWLKTPGSVAWNAFRLGIISKQELDQWYESRRRDKMAARAEGRDVFRSAVLERDGDHCVICGSQEQLEVDHIIDLWKGGPNKPSNGVTLCRACHKLKTHPKPGSSWHRFVSRYATVVTRLGYRVEYGWCSEHKHHYLVARSVAEPSGETPSPPR